MNIILIGMPGSGKTTIGKLLEQNLNDFVFVDTDEMIVQAEQKSINDIFAENGEDYFRETETKKLVCALNGKNRIVSTGGGIVKREENRLILKKQSVVIYLKTTPEELYSRVKSNTERPLLKDDAKSKIKLLYEQRHKLYEETATVQIITEGKTPDIIAEEITKEIYGKR